MLEQKKLQFCGTKFTTRIDNKEILCLALSHTFTRLIIRKPYGRRTCSRCVEASTKPPVASYDYSVKYQSFDEQLFSYEDNFQLGTLNNGAEKFEENLLICLVTSSSQQTESSIIYNCHRTKMVLLTFSQITKCYPIAFIIWLFIHDCLSLSTDLRPATPASPIGAT